MNSIIKEVSKINENFFLYYNRDKSSKVFIIIGICLIVLGLMLMQYIIDSKINLGIVFIISFGIMMLITVGFSLMHKSLRGAWL